MWKSRRKSSREIDHNNNNNNNNIQRSSPNLHFIHSSLKDVVNLFSDDPTQALAQPSPSPRSTTATSTSTRRLSIFHRVHLASKFARAFSSNLTLNNNSPIISPPFSTHTSPDNNILTKSSKSIQSNPQIPITRPEKPASVNELTKSSKSTQSDCDISIPSVNEPDKPSPDNKLTKSISSTQSNHQISIPGAENRVIIYTTSLRVVRRTFEACRTVQSILRTFRVLIDERDLSMDSRFVTELQSIMNQGNEGKLELPMVFIGGRYIGGAEEVRQLHESGELKKVLERLPVVRGGVCEGCGDFRFVVCDECSGSRKCYSEKGGFRSCMLCNENGLIRCPLCLGC